MNRFWRHISFLLSLLILAGSLSAASLPDKGKKKKKKGAKQELSEAQRVQIQTYFYKAQKEKMKGNYELAAQQFESCLKVDPDIPAVLYELSLIYNHLKLDAKALNCIEKAVKLDETNQWYRLQLASLYRKNARFSEAAKEMELLVEAHPNKLEYYDLLGRVLQLQGKDKEAIAVFNKLEERAGIDEKLSLTKKRLWLKMGQKEEAAGELNRLIEKYPDEPVFYRYLAEFYLETGQEEKALATYRKMEEVDPGNPYLNLALADYYRKKKELDNAQVELKKAFASENLDIDTKINILLSFYTVSEWDEDSKVRAYELSRVLVATHPKEAKAHSIYGDFLSRDQHMEEARDAYRKALELDRDRYLIWRELLVIESDLRDWKAMANESENAIELFPNQPLLYLFHGIAQLQKQDYSVATEFLEIGKDLVVDDIRLKGQFFSNLGESYHNLKDYPQSDFYFDEALRLNPTNVVVLNNYAYYLSLRKEKLEKAAKMSQITLKANPNSSTYLDTYAWILYQQGNYVEASTEIQKAIKADGRKSAVLLEHYGDILFRMDEVEGALEQWSEALKMGGGSDKLERKVAEKQLYE